MYLKHTFSAIIPVYNEAIRLRKVLNAALNSQLLDEVIVINDGSTDDSQKVLLPYATKIRLISLPQNSGKAKAVFTGIKSAQSEYIFLIDADLIGLKPAHIDYSIKYFTSHRLDMVLIQTAAHWSKDIKLALLGEDIIITGQRIINKSLLPKKVPNNKMGFGLELYLNNLALKKKWLVGAIFWPRKKLIATPSKFHKNGLAKGVDGYINMLKEMSEAGTLSDYLKHYQKYVIKHRLQYVLDKII